MAGRGQRLRPCPVANLVLMNTYYLADLIPCKSVLFLTTPTMFSTNVHLLSTYHIPDSELATRV